MGFVIWRSNPSNDVKQEKYALKKQILFAASVSLLNPHAILDTIGVIGTNSIQYIGSENGLSHLQLLSFLDLVYKLSFSGEISKKTRLNRKGNLIIK